MSGNDSGAATIATSSTTSTSIAATWRTAMVAAQTAPAGAKDSALDAVMTMEDAIAAAPVEDIDGAALRLRVALTMAGRQGEDSDPAWCLVADALTFLDQPSAV